MDEQQIQQRLVARVGSMIVDAETRVVAVESERDYYKARCIELERQVADYQGQIAERDIAAAERDTTPEPTFHDM